MKLPIPILALFLFLPFEAFGQGTYYNSIDTGSSAFVTDLHNLIYPHTKVAYAQFDETNVVFVSRDTTGGQKVVTCVYSGENFVYTAPFAWTTFSREHTYCHSWMPSWPAESPELQEYADQHHLFPTNQNNANGVRSNHPLGVVATVTSSYLLGKLGTNSGGETVYEPRNSHKGDAARALLYMSVCYNGVNGKDWSFNYLNNTTLPALSEAPQSVDVLIQWHNQDPPDDWEKARNEYIYSIQGNRNPFIDHPEYVGVIDFNTLTKKTAVTLAAEPTNYQRGFGYFDPTLTDTSITVRWADTTGAVLPTGYILFANTSGTFTDPSDGVVYSDDQILSDGIAAVNIAYSDADSFRFGGLSSATSYYFKIFPYNGYGNQRNYKTANFPTNTSYIVYTTASAGISVPSIVVNEYFNGGTGVSEWIELLVISDSLDMRGMKIFDFSASGGRQNAANPLTFASVSSWQFVREGTFVVIYLSGTGAPTEDTDFSDKKVIFSSANTSFFTGATTAFSIAGSTDGVEVTTAGTTHIHSLGHGTQSGELSTLSQPKGNVAGSSSSGSVVRFTNTSTVNDFSVDAKVVHGGTATPGLPNDATQTTFVNTVLPVELISFTAAVTGKNVRLLWRTATETNNHGFEIEKFENLKISKFDNPSWQKIGFLQGNGTSNSPQSYSFVDASARGKVQYRLKQIDRDGSFEYSPAVEVILSNTPQQFALLQNYPNPFNPTTTIGFTLPVSGFTTLMVHDALGREVATLVNGEKEAGSHSVPFTAPLLNSGIYFYTMKSGGFSATRKLVLMK